MLFSKKLALIISALVLSFFFWQPVRAMPIGTLLYRTSNDGNLYGYNTTQLVNVKNKMVKNIYTGHVAIYIGQEEGVDYIVEATANGIVKTPAKYFLNSNNNEQIIGAKIPKNMTEAQRIKIVELAKKMAESNLSYDFDFKKQKGPSSGEWICVGVTEKIYESANISNPLDLSQLEYNPDLYGVDITPDGFDNFSIINNETGDCLSKNLEFSKIEADSRTLIPFPEIFGFNAGLEYSGERFFFFPITQYWQNSLENVPVDILLESDFNDSEIRGDIPELAMIFKWSLVNNPNSSINRIINNIIALFSKNNNNPIENNDNSEEGDDNYSDDDLIATSTDPGDSNISDDDLDILDKPEDEENEDNQEDEGDNNEDDEDDGSIIIEEGDDEDEEDDNENNNEESEDNQEEEDNNNNEEEDNNNDDQDELDILTNKLLISRIYTTLTDDYIELYNPNNIALNLEELNIRLYKTKTSATPSLILRIGNLNDGSYPGGTIIPAQGKYLIARSSADITIKNQAQAIITRSNFTFTGNGYTIYLSQGVVSSNTDEDIIDKVGYGSAIYFESLPALEILNNHLLVRKAKNNSTAISMKEDGLDFSLGNSFDSNNNNFDFVLINLIPEDNDNDNDNNDNNNNDDDDDNNNNNDDNTDNEDDENDNDNNNNDENNSEATSSPQLLISKIYTTDTDDYIEIYNPNDFDINLETSGIRLHKTKTSVSPSLVMRIGNLVDGYYPGGVNISSHGKYLIARASSSEEILNQAQAIATRSDFTFTGDGYTIYLGDDTISNDNDEDIIDKVGYGNASYYQVLPASEILDHHLLVRKALASSTVESMSLNGSDFNMGHGFNSLNNNFDFVLISLLEDEEENGEEEEDEEEENNNEEDEEEDEEGDEGDDEEFLEGEENDGNFFNYCIDPGLYLNNIIHLWHLDECQGTSTFDFADNKISSIDSIWQEGKFGCGLKQYYSQPSLSTTLNNSFDSNNFSVSFYYKNLFLNSRPTIKFFNSVSGDFFRIMLYPSFTDFYNVPGVDSRVRSLIWPNDDNWHLFTWVVNKPNNYWAIYRDGQEVYRVEMGLNMFIEVDKFSIKGDNGYNLMDEIILFNRALTPNEISQINDYDLPINTVSCQAISPKVPEIINYWNFDETMGELANDIVGQSHMTISPENRVITGSVNNYLKVSSSFPEILVDFINPYSSTDLAMAFWWKNENSSSTDSLIKLMTSNKDIFGLNINSQDVFCYFNDNNFKANDEELLIPIDGLWHNIVLSYSSYWLKLNIFVDGELKASFSKDWLDSSLVRKLIIDSSEDDYYLDELSIWNWSLNLADISTIYNIQKTHFGY